MTPDSEVTPEPVSPAPSPEELAALEEEQRAEAARLEELRLEELRLAREKFVRESVADLKTRLALPVDEPLLALALSHPSSVGEGLERTLKSNQRLEFLGDALVGAIVAAHFYETEPELPEGELTKRKIAAVRQSALASAARRLYLGRAIVFARGEDSAGGRERDSNLSDAFEALVGAIYLSCGFATTRDFVLKILEPELKTDPASLVPAKNRLQELTQAIGLGTPIYKTAQISPKRHFFSSEVFLNGEKRGRGQGNSKKLAEENAAIAALKTIQE